MKKPYGVILTTFFETAIKEIMVESFRMTVAR